MKVNNKIVIWIVVSLLCITMLTIGYGIFNRIVNSNDSRHFIVSIGLQVDEPELQMVTPIFITLESDVVPSTHTIKRLLYHSYSYLDTLNNDHSKLNVYVYMINEVSRIDYLEYRNTGK